MSYILEMENWVIPDLKELCVKGESHLCMYTKKRQNNRERERYKNWEKQIEIERIHVITEEGFKQKEPPLPITIWYIKYYINILQENYVICWVRTIAYSHRKVIHLHKLKIHKWRVKLLLHIFYWFILLRIYALFHHFTCIRLLPSWYWNCYISKALFQYAVSQNVHSCRKCWS